MTPEEKEELEEERKRVKKLFEEDKLLEVKEDKEINYHDSIKRLEDYVLLIEAARDPHNFHNITLVGKNPTAEAETLLDTEKLANILNFSSQTIKTKLSRNPEQLPPAFFLPGSRKPQWHPDVVRQWLKKAAGIQELEATQQKTTTKKRGRPSNVSRKRQNGL